jgi:hypothetical protein
MGSDFIIRREGNAITFRNDCLACVTVFSTNDEETRRFFQWGATYLTIVAFFLLGESLVFPGAALFRRIGNDRSKGIKGVRERGKTDRGG